MWRSSCKAQPSTASPSVSLVTGPTAVLTVSAIVVGLLVMMWPILTKGKLPLQPLFAPLMYQCNTSGCPRCFGRLIFGDSWGSRLS